MNGISTAESRESATQGSTKMLGTQEWSHGTLASPVVPAAKAVGELHPTRAIRRLVRHRATRQYYKEGGWTLNPDEATEFLDALEAAQLCARHRLTDVELALWVGSGDCEIFCTPMR